MYLHGNSNGSDTFARQSRYLAENSRLHLNIAIFMSAKAGFLIERNGGLYTCGPGCQKDVPRAPCLPTPPRERGVVYMVHAKELLRCFRKHRILYVAFAVHQHKIDQVHEHFAFDHTFIGMYVCIAWCVFPHTKNFCCVRVQMPSAGMLEAHAGCKCT